MSASVNHSIAIVSRGVGPPWIDGMVKSQVVLAESLSDFEFHWYGMSDWTPSEAHFFVSSVVSDRSWSPASRLRFFRWFISRRVDIYHLIFHMRPSTARILAPLLRRKPVVQTVQTAFEHGTDIAPLLLGDELIAVSDRIRRQIEPFAGDSGLTVIVPSVNPSQVQTQSRSAEPKSLQFVDDRSRFVLYAGNYSRELGVVDAVRVFELLALDDPKLRFVIANRPSSAIENQQIVEREVRRIVQEAGLSDRTIFLGTTEGFLGLLKRAEVLVFPALDLSGTKLDMPLVLLEAMALGTPIAVCDIEPFADIELSRSGTVSRPGDIAEFAGAVQGMMMSPQRLTDARKGGLALLGEQFNPETQALVLRDVYRRAARRIR